VAVFSLHLNSSASWLTLDEHSLINPYLLCLVFPLIAISFHLFCQTLASSMRQGVAYQKENEFHHYFVQT